RLNDNLVVITNNKTDSGISSITITVTGVVANAKGESLQGVTIQEKGTNNVTVSKENGAFLLNVTNAKSILVFSYVGYQSQEQAIPADKILSVVLQEGEANLNEVVVIGYGSRRKKDITGAVSVVNSKDIEKSTALTPELAMQGQMAGVSVTSAGSNPTARPTVRIRGVNTFSGNGAADPLYIIDGVPIVEGGAGAVVDKVNDPTRRGPVNLYTIINPNDIESITVLKDASASAIYGVRAANGVVLVTTKTGKKGRVRVDVDAAYGVQKVPKTYSVLNTQQYVKFYTDAYTAYPDLSGTTAIPIEQAQYFGPLWSPSDPGYIGNRSTYDWQNAVINHHSKNQNYNVRVS
ncbi:MAG TPA: TonB-dependent receptor plug domain-containing protein, partial [Ferruginibacter sp.]|nr:TonB-dependent receptor plug domain-containing protein [Ferruginibacter sp.]